MTFPLPSTELPEWVASFDLEALDTDRDAAGGTQEGTTTWPIDIRRADATCQLARFGPGGRGLVLLDGYLFDREDLSRELKLETPAGSYAELAARAYDHWGSEAFGRLDGRFLMAGRVVGEAEPNSIIVILNWLGEVQRQVPN